MRELTAVVVVVVVVVVAEHSCLWNKKSENHNNRQLRLRLLEALRAQLSDQAASVSGKHRILLLL